MARARNGQKPEITKRRTETAARSTTKKPTARVPAKKPAARRKKPPMAERYDLHELYEQSVQAPAEDCKLFRKLFKKLRGREPLVLREDFCGTAQLSAAWCLGDKRRSAIAVDLDGPTLAWGREHNLEPNRRRLGSRMRLLQRDVLEPSVGRADITAANNFSFCIFKTRDLLRSYLERARQGLKRDGVLFLEIFGGKDSIYPLVEERELDRWTYVWEQESFDPITHHTMCRIHFNFPDGSKIHNAFSYDWRLWSLPELNDLLLEVGFRDVRVFWEKIEEEDTDGDGICDGTGEYEDVTGKPVEQIESFLVYMAGLR